MTMTSINNNQTTMKEFKTILDALITSLTFASSAMKATCTQVVNELSMEEMEIAASTSYVYWWLSKKQLKNNEDAECVKNARHAMAMRECRRHCIGEGGDYQKTLLAIKEAMAYRIEFDLDSLRACTEFAGDPNYPSETLLKDKENDDEPISLAALREMIVDELVNKQAMVVRGHGKEQQAILYKHPRTVPTKETNIQAFALANLYVAERAIAATEYLSKGRGQEKLIVVFDFVDYDSSNSPPSGMFVKFATALQRMYPERLKKFVFLEASFWLRVIYNMVYPFLAHDTREKISFLTDTKSAELKEATFGDIVDPSQATRHILDNGELTSELDMDHFVNAVPFHRLYDDIDLPVSK